jgi:hypothetical protein
VDDAVKEPILRTVFAVIAGFVTWIMLWIGSEQILSALWPEWFGAQQQAFQEALEKGTPFNSQTSFLLTHVVFGAIVSLLAGFMAAVVAKENKWAPFVLSQVLLGLGLLKLVMSWPYVPLWYHVVFTTLLVPMTLLGGKLRRAAA